MYQVGELILCRGKGVCRVKAVGLVNMSGIQKDRLYYTPDPLYMALKQLADELGIVKPPGWKLYPPFQKKPRIAKKLSAVIFSFDSFSEYPRNFDRGYSEKLSKSDNGLYSFPQINAEKPVLFTESSHSDGIYHNARAPPRKSESSINHIQVFGGGLMNYQLYSKKFLKKFHNPDNRCSGQGLLSFPESEEGRLSA